ncbi:MULTISPECIES: hypothetical protein [Bradyrhizobium]|jgi:hypothetical protein|uniref:Uncharacterized protein n=2 Tax=Bradyrhizobium TaxID=374 RepID=A0ABS5G150_9BRAD|nr:MULTISPECIES: hypothetical protein [Bradyrhizobium]MBR1135050.1 hypothetical protein [Bradyrhizobium denitrificans]MDU0959733.1 hypothetical protein [Bradyrhizobium sp.]MDU1493936.1 hypothetical protein [Bradyrhizobium sp.]MDU1544094.1 hypothetical protein [Bradyrhizobium sp.]MDU1807342.1 hypothetical protein [Bradyrhizobium sp.]
MMIARRADTRARADFATWKMIAKLNGASGLPPAAQEFLASYKTRLNEMSEHEATEATIREMYKAYYAEMGGGGAPPEVKPVKAEPVTDNVTAFRRLPPKPKTAQTGRSAPRKMPVALIFIALCVLFVGIKLYWP